jgi:hypothetical protein
MRIFIPLIAALISACSPVMAADGAACYTISDADVRAKCLAEARRAPSMCYAIQDAAKRAVCFSEVQR